MCQVFAIDTAILTCLSSGETANGYQRFKQHSHPLSIPSIRANKYIPALLEQALIDAMVVHQVVIPVITLTYNFQHYCYYIPYFYTSASILSLQ